MRYNNNLYTDIGITTTYPMNPYGVDYSSNSVTIENLITSPITPITMTTDNPCELKINVKKKPIKFNFNL